MCSTWVSGIWLPTSSGRLPGTGKHPVDLGQALPDWSGAYLLMTLARHDPDRIRALDPPTWSKWAPAIVGAWVSRRMTA